MQVALYANKNWERLRNSGLRPGMIGERCIYYNAIPTEAKQRGHFHGLKVGLHAQPVHVFLVTRSRPSMEPYPIAYLIR